jgi:hypothetical protein
MDDMQPPTTPTCLATIAQEYAQALRAQAPAQEMASIAARARDAATHPEQVEYWWRRAEQWAQWANVVTSKTGKYLD